MKRVASVVELGVAGVEVSLGVNSLLNLSGSVTVARQMVCVDELVSYLVFV